VPVCVRARARQCAGALSAWTRQRLCPRPRPRQRLSPGLFHCPSLSGQSMPRPAHAASVAALDTEGRAGTDACARTCVCVRMCVLTGRCGQGSGSEGLLFDHIGIQPLAFVHMRAASTRAATRASKGTTRQGMRTENRQRSVASRDTSIKRWTSSPVFASKSSAMPATTSRHASTARRA
jgi:hypothetical protein